MLTDVAEIVDEPALGKKSLQFQDLWVPAEKYHGYLDSVLLYCLEIYRTKKSQD